MSTLEKTKKAVAESETSAQGGTKNVSEITQAIKVIEEEELQLSEVTEVEKTSILEVASHLKQVLKQLGNTFHVDPSLLTDIQISPDGIVSMMSGSDVAVSAQLENLPTGVLKGILAEVLPKIKENMSAERQKIGDNADDMEKVATEFRKVTAVIPKQKSEPIFPPPEKMKERAESIDALKASLSK